MKIDRRDWLLSLSAAALTPFAAFAKSEPPLKITGLKITPIALPDPPLLAASGCHGPYFLRSIVEVETDAGIVGIGETRGGQTRTEALEKARPLVVGQNAFAYRKFARDVRALDNAAYAGIELACLDACGRATKRSLSQLLGGPVRDEVEFAAYLFYRYASDHPKLLADRRIVDGRGKGAKALDDYGEVRTPEAMVRLADRFRKQFGFRFFKLKAGVLPPDQEWDTLKQMNAHFKGKFPLRIDPNARWTMKTALRIGKKLKDVNLEYYEDPVKGQEAMARVRKELRLPMSTNMCVKVFEQVPSALKLEPIDVVLCDHHGWGGITACQELGRICQTVGWKMSQHSNNHAGVTMAAMTHVAAVCPQLTVASDTHYPWLIEGADIIVGKNFALRDGKLRVPTAPGVGVELDADKLARAHETWKKSGLRERVDDETMRLVEPGWHKTLY